MCTTDGCRRRSPARVDAVNQIALGRKVAPRLRDARDVWVVATSASNGYAAALSGRPYSAWIGTGLEEEWAGRRPGLRASRRLAIRVNAPVLRRMERRGARRRAPRLRDVAVQPRQRRPRRRSRRGRGRHPAAAGRPRALLRPLRTTAWEATLDEPVLVFVGRANDPRKNVRLLLDALPLLPGVRALLVGEPPRGAASRAGRGDRRRPVDRPVPAPGTLLVAPVAPGGLRDRRRRGAGGRSARRDHAVRRAGGARPRLEGRRRAFRLLGRGARRDGARALLADPVRLDVHAPDAAASTSPVSTRRSGSASCCGEALA